MKEQFVEWEPRTAAVRRRLDQASLIVEEYSALGYRLTLRQLYYQMVSRGHIRNTIKEYKNLSVTLTNARRGGHIDWDALEDRSRQVLAPSQWTGAAHVLRDAAAQFRLDRWAGQARHVEIWCEKDALSSVLQPAAFDYHVRLLPVRGYSSATVAYEAAQRFRAADAIGKSPVVIYLGDHDPSGLDMSDELERRLQELSAGVPVRMERVALNFRQVEAQRLPPNPTKTTDSRTPSYVELYGEECWELDALDPALLDGMVRTSIEEELDMDLYRDVVDLEEAVRAQLMAYATFVEGPI